MYRLFELCFFIGLWSLLAAQCVIITVSTDWHCGVDRAIRCLTFAGTLGLVMASLIVFFGT